MAYMNFPTDPLESGQIHLNWKNETLPNGRVKVTSKNFPGVVAEGATLGVAISNGQKAVLRGLHEGKLQQKR